MSTPMDPADATPLRRLARTASRTAYDQLRELLRLLPAKVRGHPRLCGVARRD